MYKFSLAKTKAHTARLLFLAKGEYSFLKSVSLRSQQPSVPVRNVQKLVQEMTREDIHVILQLFVFMILI